MNASEFNTELTKLIARAIKEGITVKNVGFETVIGIIESQKHALFDWRIASQAAAAQQALESQRNEIVIPGGIQIRDGQ